MPGATERPAAQEEERELAALRAGDERAFLALVNRHHRGMVRAAAFYVQGTATAEEVVQEAWLGVLRGLHLFEGRSSLKSWIFGIVVNCARARAAREARSVPLSALEREQDDQGPSVSPDRFVDGDQRWSGNWAQPPVAWPDAKLASKEMLSLVRGALETLPAAQRSVMTQRDVDGWDSEEVCALLGISEGNQRVLLHRARSKVRGYLEQRLGGEVRP